MKEAVRDAARDPSFVYLTVGFFVCGFHVAFIATHLPGVVASCLLPPEVGAWSLSLIGLFNILGSFAAGWAVGRWRMKSVLAVIYASRAVAVLAFLAAPKTTTTFLLFAMAIGFTYLATVPPTVGLVGKLHGMRFREQAAHAAGAWQVAEPPGIERLGERRGLSVEHLVTTGNRDLFALPGHFQRDVNGGGEADREADVLHASRESSPREREPVRSRSERRKTVSAFLGGGRLPPAHHCVARQRNLDGRHAGAARVGDRTDDGAGCRAGDLSGRRGNWRQKEKG